MPYHEVIAVINTYGSDRLWHALRFDIVELGGGSRTQPDVRLAVKENPHLNE
jgi:hypothetical protein